ncbi:DUF4190 domain-containing protein [Amycolatopsis sp. NPDC059021]|uniref:DUF4190 domain-containing protein n=1 Tax=Amycolatopsis sp. NPDC059021 TaxID=3346704 RepID=UPI00366C51FF
MSDSPVPRAVPPSGPSYEDAPPPPPQPVPPGTNGLAVASLVLGIVGGILLSAIFGFVALRQTRRTGQAGRKLAIAGLTLSGVWLAVILIAVTVTATGSRQLADNELSVFSLNDGQCFNATEVNSTTVAKTQCTVPHDSQVFGKALLPGADAYPGEAQLKSTGLTECHAQAKAFFTNGAPEGLKLNVYYPSEAGWRSQVRTAVCVFQSATGQLYQPVRP